MSEPWVNPDGSTNVDGWLAAYAEDDNNFWRTDPGHIMNVVDELIDLLEAAREWRGSLIPKTSTGVAGPTVALIKAIEVFDD